MPSIETGGRKKKAVLWEKAGNDNYADVTVYEAVEIKVRWEQTSREVKDPNGQPIEITDQVLVNRDIPIGSIMWKGGIDDLPSPPTNLRRVMSVESAGDIRDRKTQRVVSLARFSDQLPEVVGTGS